MELLGFYNKLVLALTKTVDFLKKNENPEIKLTLLNDKFLIINRGYDRSNNRNRSRRSHLQFVDSIFKLPISIL